MSRRRLVPLLLALASLGACIPDTSGIAVDASPPAPLPGARAGGTLRIAIDEPAGIDPTDARGPGAHIVVSAMCDTLLTVGADGRVKPALAESWTIADDGRKLFVKVRKGVRFHNGREVTSEDVIYTLSRLASEEFAAAAASLMEPVAGYGFVHGEDETENRRFRERLLGLRAIDGRTVEFELSRPFADFHRALAHPATAPVPREEIEDGDAAAFAARPVCAGPYRLERPWRAGETIRLVRVEGYPAVDTATTRGGRGYADVIELVPFARRSQQARAFALGRVDVAQVPEELGARLRARMPDDLASAATGQVEWLGYPTTTPPFDRAEVRRALSLVLDRSALAAVYDGGRRPSTSALPPSIPPAVECPELRGAPSVEGARELLRSAGVDLAGTTIRLYHNADASNAALAAAIARRWRDALGVRVRVVAMGWSDYVARGTSPDGFDGAFRYGWAAPYPSPDAYLVPLFHPDSVGRDNLSRFGSRDFTAAIRRARRATAQDERADAYARAAAVVCREMPMTPLVEDLRSYALGERVAPAAEGWTSPLDGTVDAREIFVR